MKQNSAIIKQIPQLIDQLELCLRSGYSLRQAFSILADDLQAPIAIELRWLAQTIDAGVALPSALDTLVARVPHGDMDLLVAAIKVQLEIGGNLADKLGFLGQLLAKRQLASEVG